MCFSASASFTAAAVTAVAGTVAVSAARGTRYRPLAVIPVFFALQQVAEGVLWRTFDGSVSAAWRTPAVYLFLFVANVLWPIWVPLSFRSGERHPTRRRILSALLALGVGVSVAHGWALGAHLATAAPQGGHIAYQIPTPWRAWAIVAALYPVVVVAPPLLAGTWMLRLVGVAVLVSLVVARVAYLESAASVWCFFAAIISGLVAVAIRLEVARDPHRPVAAPV